MHESIWCGGGMLLKGKTEVIELARDEEVLANDRAAVFGLGDV